VEAADDFKELGLPLGDDGLVRVPEELLRPTGYPIRPLFRLVLGIGGTGV
jgi:hypothetical protein